MNEVRPLTDWERLALVVSVLCNVALVLILWRFVRSV